MIVSQSHHREEKFQKIIDFHKEFPETFSNNVTSPDFAKNRWKHAQKSIFQAQKVPKTIGSSSLYPKPLGTQKKRFLSNFYHFLAKMLVAQLLSNFQPFLQGSKEKTRVRAYTCVKPFWCAVRAGKFFGFTQIFTQRYFRPMNRWKSKIYENFSPGSDTSPPYDSHTTLYSF